MFKCFQLHGRDFHYKSGILSSTPLLEAFHRYGLIQLFCNDSSCQVSAGQSYAHGTFVENDRKFYITLEEPVYYA